MTIEAANKLISARAGSRFDWRLHGPPLLVILSLAVASALVFRGIGYEYGWTSDTTDTFYRIVSTMRPAPAVSDARPGLFATMAMEMGKVIAAEPLPRWYQGLFDAYLRTFQIAYGDISLAYKTQVLPLTLVFGIGAYFLFFWLTKNRWISLALTIAALLPMPFSWAGERSGLGPIWTYTRRYFLTAWLPLLSLLYFRGALGNRRLLMAAVAAIGVASNLHSSGILLLETMVLAWLLFSGINPKRIMQAGGLLLLGAAFSVLSLGSLWAQGLRAISDILLGLAITDAHATAVALLENAKQSVPPELRYLFYPPRIYQHLPGALVDLWLIATSALSVLPLFLRQRKHYESALFLATAACLLFVSFEQMWVWVLLGAVLHLATREGHRPPSYELACYLVIANYWVAVFGMLLFQAAYQLVDGFPLIFNQLRGIRFMGLWVFVWLAAIAIPQLTPNGPIDSPNKRWIIRLALGVVCVVSAQNVYRQYFKTADRERFERQSALLEVAAWAKGNTSPNSIFLVGYSPFGVVSERAITHTEKQVRNQSIDWLAPKGDLPPKDAVDRATQHAATHVILATDRLAASLKTCALFANRRYTLAEVQCVQRSAAGSGLAPEKSLH